MKTNKWLKRSIANQYVWLVGFFAVAFFIGLFSLLGYQQYINKQYASVNNQLEEKEILAHQLERTYNQVFFEVRGYLALDDSTMRDSALQLQDEITNTIVSLKEAAETQEDLMFVSDVSNFHSFYFEEYLPKLLDAYKGENETVSVATLAKESGTVRIHDLQTNMSTYTIDVETQMHDNFIGYSTKQNISQWFFVIFLVLMLGIYLTIMRTMLKKFGAPLQELASVAEEIATGKDIVTIPQNNNREDELGMLSLAFDKMIRSIQDNEQNLVAQNEELIAQQDELRSQKEELEHAVDRIQSNEANLKRRNDLIKSLTNSLNKGEVLKNIVENICRVLNSDCGIIALVDSNNEYAAFGLSATEEKQFIKNLESGMILRLKDTKKAFTIKRNCSLMEKGYHVNEMYCYDLFVPVFSSTNNLVAVMLFTRFANAYTKQEIEEYIGFSKQISLSLERISIFEESEIDRLLTQDMLNTLREGVQLVDENGVIIQVNTIMHNLYTFDSSYNMVNQPFEMWCNMLDQSIEDVDTLTEFMKTVILGKNIQTKTHIYHITSPVKRVIQVYFEELYRGNKKYGTLFVHQDITKAYEVDQMKSEFVSTVSHELRTPLSSVLGFTELMLNKELKPERQQKYLNTIYQEAKRLTALINDFLDVQRMESGKQSYEKKYEDILPIIQQVIDSYRVNYPVHRFIIQKKTSNTIVLGDTDKLTQVFNNLIINAVKYSPDGGEIKVVLYEKEKALYVDVVDEGLGIPDDAIPNLFAKFYRVDNSDRRKIGGTGLGLSIVNEIMKAHEGKVSVTSEIKKGSTFTLSFPLVLSKIIEESPVEDIPQNSTDNSVNVIVIEDDKNLASLIQTELEDNGFHVLQYIDGETGMNAIQQYKPDTIVLDIMLNETGVNGWEILEKVKHNPDLKDIPIIISSALEEKEKGFRLGASEYLVKPYPPHKLSSTILQTLLKKEKSGQILVPDNTDI